MASAIIALAVQTAKGTPATVSTERFLLTAGSPPGPVKVPVASEGSSASQRFPMSAYTPSLRVQGDMSLILRPNAIGLLLYAALGAKAVSGAADPWTHTFTVAAAQQPWLTVWRSIGGVINERFSDCKVTSLRFVSRAGSPVRVSVGIMGITSVHRTAPETAAPIEVTGHFMHWHGKGAYQVEGVAVAQIADWSLEIDTGASARDTLAAYDVRTGARIRVTARVGQTVVNDDLYARHVYGIADPANDAAAVLTPLELGGTGLVFKLTEAVTPERSLELSIPRPVLRDPGLGGIGTDGQPLRQEALYEALMPATGSGVTAVLRNARSAY